MSKSELLLGGLGGGRADFESLGRFSLGSLGVCFPEKGLTGSCGPLLSSIFTFLAEFPSGPSLSKVASLPWRVMLGIGMILVALAFSNFKVLVFPGVENSLMELG